MTIDQKGISRLYIIQLQLSREVYVISSKYRVLRSRVLPDQVSNSIYVTLPNVWTGKDSFATHLKDVPVLYPYTYPSAVDHYDHATSASVSVPRQTCLFNSARE